MFMIPGSRANRKGYLKTKRWVWTNGFVDLSGGGNTIPIPQWLPPKQEFSKDAVVFIQAWGAGGSGCQQTTIAGNTAGGGGGGYSEVWMKLSKFPDSVVNVWVGHGGNAVTEANGSFIAGKDGDCTVLGGILRDSNGSAFGTNTWIEQHSSTIYIMAGGGERGDSSVGGQGGTMTISGRATTGSGGTLGYHLMINSTGNTVHGQGSSSKNGWSGIWTGGGGGGQSDSLNTSYNGGNSHFGGGGGAGHTGGSGALAANGGVSVMGGNGGSAVANGNTTFLDGKFPGGGGAGHCNGTAGQYSGAGANGQLIITVFDVR